MIKIAIIDDQKSDLKYISNEVKSKLDARKIRYEIFLYTNPSQLLIDNEKNCFDVIFLDIDMPDQLNGLDIAETINNVSSKTVLVFVTNHDELVYKAYRFKAVGFIRKGFLKDEIDEITDIILSEIHKRNHTISISDSNSIIKIDLFDVLYMKSDDHYAEIYFKEGKRCVRQSLNKIETQIEHYGFIRTHSRYLVNYRYIYSIEKTVVILTDGKTQVPVSRNKVASVKEKFQMFVRSI